MGHNRAGDHVRVIKRRRRKEQARLARKAETAEAGASASPKEGVLARAKHVAEVAAHKVGDAAHKVGDAAKVAAGAVKHAYDAVTGHDKPKEGKPE